MTIANSDHFPEQSIPSISTQGEKEFQINARSSQLVLADGTTYDILVTRTSTSKDANPKIETELRRILENANEALFANLDKLQIKNRSDGEDRRFILTDSDNIGTTTVSKFFEKHIATISFKRAIDLPPPPPATKDVAEIATPVLEAPPLPVDTDGDLVPPPVLRSASKSVESEADTGKELVHDYTIKGQTYGTQKTTRNDTLEQDRSFLKATLQHLQEKLGAASTDTEKRALTKEVEYYQGQLDKTSALLAKQSWVHSHYVRDLLNGAPSFEEGIADYVPAPVNMRSVEATGVEGNTKAKFLRLGVMSDMRNGFMSLGEMRQLKTAYKKIDETSQKAAQEKSSLEENLQSAAEKLGLSSLMNKIKELELNKTGDMSPAKQELVRAARSLSPNWQQQPLKKVLSDLAGIQSLCQLFEGSAKKRSKEIETFMSAFYALPDTKRFLELSDAPPTPSSSTQETPTLSRTNRSLSKQFKEVAKKLNFKQVLEDLGTIAATGEMPKKLKELTKQIQQNKALPEAVLPQLKEIQTLLDEQSCPSLDKFLSNKKVQSIAYAAAQAKEAQSHPGSLDRMIDERTKVLERQMIQLVCGQMNQNTDKLEKIFQQGGKSFDLVHVSLLNPQTSQLDASGWMHDERVEIEDMSEIFDIFQDKALIFDGKGPYIDEAGVHLPIKKEVEGKPATLQLNTYFFNISPQGHIENDGMQKELNKTNMDKMRAKGLMKGEDSLSKKISGDEVLRSQEKGYPLAEKFVQTLGQMEGLHLSLGCLSAKDRSGLVSESIAINLLPPLVQGTFKKERLKAGSTQVQISQDNARVSPEGRIVNFLKVNPLQSRGLSMRERFLTLRDMALFLGATALLQAKDYFSTKAVRFLSSKRRHLG